MDLRIWMLMALLAGYATANVQAQDDAPDWKRWTVRYFSALDVGNGFNASGIASYLEENDFDGREVSFGTTLDYPLTRAEGGTGWSLFAAYAYRPWLKVGASLHHGVTVSASGLWDRIGSTSRTGRLRISQSMWAMAPIALWTPVSNVVVGAGPAVIRGAITLTDTRALLSVQERMDPQEDTFLRLGAVAFASIGFTLGRTLYVGVQGQYLYSGEGGVGPFPLEERFFDRDALESSSVRFDQVTLGPVVGIRF